MVHMSLAPNEKGRTNRTRGPTAKGPWPELCRFFCSSGRLHAPGQKQRHVYQEQTEDMSLAQNWISVIQACVQDQDRDEVVMQKVKSLLSVSGVVPKRRLTEKKV